MSNIVVIPGMFNIFITEAIVHVDPSHLFQAVAGNVRRLRTARGWSQQELGDRSDVSRTMIVRIESGEGNASLATLGRIALAFGVPFTEIVQAPSSACPAASPIQVWQGERPGTRVTLLGSFVGQRMMDLFEVRLAPGDSYQGEPDQPGTRELVYVVAGTLALDHGEGIQDLKAREMVVFPSDRPCTFSNRSRRPVCFLLSVVG
ncbi:MAG TPA: XRE family transcriptional regulator [Holophaga sp.]|nr:XRE family transcriptional regulator [Holophaga sp.]